MIYCFPANPSAIFRYTNGTQISSSLIAAPALSFAATKAACASTLQTRKLGTA